MAGGVDAAIARGEREIAEIFPNLPTGAKAVDLGAGFGMRTVPLARRGCTVTAIDTSVLLLDELRRQCSGLPVEAIEDDLLAFRRPVHPGVDVIPLMGDTLTHLADEAAVERLFALSAAALRTDGLFVAAFRDYSAARRTGG